MKYKHSEDKFIHIKFERQEAIISKRDLLESEKGVLKIMRAVNNYRKLRNAEMRLKIRLYRRLKEMNRRIQKIQKSVPELRTPKIISSKKTEIKKPLKREYDDNIELELKEIQKKLAALQQ